MFDESLAEGDLLAFPIHGNWYGLAHLVRIDTLATYDNYHMVVLDVVREVTIDPYNEEESVRAAFSDADPAMLDIALDNVALMVRGVDQSAMVRVGKAPVTDNELLGYTIWMHGTTEQLMRQGLLRDDLRTAAVNDDREYEDVDDEYEAVEGEYEEDATDVQSDDDASGVDASGVDGEGADDGGAEQDDAEAPATIEVTLRPWHRGAYDRSLATVIVELRDEFAQPYLAETRMARFVNALFGAGNSEQINALVEQLLAGDYGAGHELMPYGDAAGDALARHLDNDTDPQVAEDILNSLSDMGTLATYEHIGRFFEQQVGNGGNPELRAVAVRGFCYTVTLTNGTPDPLRVRLPLLDSINDPDLQDDIKAARKAVLDAPPDLGAGNAGSATTSNPFGYA